MQVRPVCRHPSACPTGPWRRGGRAWRSPKSPGGGGEGVVKEEEKKDDDEEEMMEGEKRVEDDMQDRLGGEDSIMVKFPLVSFPCSSCFKALSIKVEIHKDPE